MRGGKCVMGGVVMRVSNHCATPHGQTPKEKTAEACLVPPTQHILLRAPVLRWVTHSLCTTTS
jgi:hypothetical protein